MNHPQTPTNVNLMTEYFRPWKLATLAIGIGLLIAGSYFITAPDWDVPISLIMGFMAYLSASWCMHVMVERRWKSFPLMLFLTWLTIDGVYALYWSVVDPFALEMMRAANFPASLSLFWMCGLVWYFNGTIAELIQQAQKHALTGEQSK